MVINMRYYVITIAAIFISLGLGIFIGFNLNGQELYLSQQKILLESLEEKFGELKLEKEYFTNQIDSLMLENQRNINFIDGVYKEMIDNKLSKLSIAIIISSDHYYYSDIRNTLESAGAKIPVEIQYTDKIFSTAPFFIMENQESWIEVKNSRELITLVNQEIEKLLALRSPSILLENLAAMGYVRYIFDEAILTNGPIHHVVLAGGGLLEDTQKIEMVDIDLIKRCGANRIPLIAVERDDVGFSYSSYYKKMKITTIDHINTTMGKISLVLSIINDQ